MRLKTVFFFSLFFTALALAPAMAHLLELPNKIHLSSEEYLTVQGIYRGWALLGFVIAGSFFSTLALMIVVRKKKNTFAFAFVALVLIAGAQILFWTYTYPANQATQNWSILPIDWTQLRLQWEYSHAAGALLHLLALVMLIFSVLTKVEAGNSKSSNR